MTEHIECHRKVCSNTPAICYNTSTLKLYCIPCARHINDCNKDLPDPICIIPQCYYCKQHRNLAPFDETTAFKDAVMTGQPLICKTCETTRSSYEAYCAENSVEPEDEGLRMYIHAWRSGKNAWPI